MTRPQTKPELLNLSKQNFDKLIDFIERMDGDEQNNEFPLGTMNRNIRDVLMHLHHWHLMMLEWYTTGMKGDKPEMPAKGYTWKITPELNKWIWEKYRNTSLDEAKESFQEIIKIVKKHTDEELFEKKRYKWTGTTSLGSYLVSATSSHYDWALKPLQKAKK